MKTYPFLRYIPDGDIEIALSTEYTENADDSLDALPCPRDICGRCFLGVAIPNAGPSPVPFHAAAAMFDLGWITTEQWDSINPEVREFVEAFDRGRLLGDTLRQVVEASRAEEERSDCGLMDVGGGHPIHLPNCPNS